MSFMRRIFVILFCLGSVLAGCDHNEKDSHTEVFKTPGEMMADRRARQLAAHKDLAISVLKFARPDIEAKPAGGTAISVSADGVTRSIDLEPIEEQMVRQSTEERAILRHYLEEQVRPFDVERLKGLPFAQVRKQAGFELLNDEALKDRQKWAGASAVRSVKIVSGVYRLTVIRRGDQTLVPLNAALIEAWHISADEADASAMENLRVRLKSAGDGLMESLTFGPLGRSGSLKQGIDPAVILLPEFLEAARAIWKTRENLVMFVPTSSGIVFVEEHNQKLLDLLVPQWKKQLAANAHPLSEQLLLRDSEHLAVFSFTPTTKPSTAPATKPRPYIVH